MKSQLTLAFALLLICSGAALAQTPDGYPPALETVCDMETGAAYGHCNAYCEAMDCELANDSDPLTEPKASATACSKVRSKFEQTTGRNLPCEVSCPCADPAVSFYFSEVLAGNISISSCWTEPGRGMLDGIEINSPDFPPGSWVYAVLLPFGWLCGGPEDGLPISPEQGQYCAQLLEQEANSQSVTCGPPPPPV